VFRAQERGAPKEPRLPEGARALFLLSEVGLDLPQPTKPSRPRSRKKHVRIDGHMRGCGLPRHASPRTAGVFCWPRRSPLYRG
jgi:hypothetical protein